METKRLIIRMFTANDWEDLYEYLSQSDVVKFEPYDVFSKEEAKKEAVARSKNDAFWAVCLKETNKLIGNVYLAKQDFDTWELGYVFNAFYQGYGYASEACRVLVNDVFTNHHAHKVIANVNPLNQASWKLLERLQLQREGHLKKNIYFKKDDNHQPIWLDTYLYGILSTEWNYIMKIK